MIVQAFTGAGGSPGGSSSDARVLLLIAQAGLKQISADTAVAAACEAIGANTLTLAQLKADAATLARIKADDAALACLRLSSTAMSELGLDAVDVTDAAAMSALSRDPAALTAFCADAAQLEAMAKTDVNSGTLDVLKAINSDIELVRGVYQSVTEGGRFTSSAAYREDNPQLLDQYCTKDAAAGSIILVATGIWNYGSGAHTLVYCDGTLVSSGLLVYPPQPSQVDADSIGAVTLPTASFDEDGDGYGAISIYRAS